MNVEDIINHTADDADSILDGISSMTEARAAIREYLEANYPQLPPPEQSRAVAGVLAVLVDEGFFTVAAGNETEGAEPGGGSDDEP